MIIAMASDHGGYELKEDLKKHLSSQGHFITDYGTHSKDAVDYPDFALLAAEAVSTGLVEVAIVVDGAGIGSAMAAGKVPGVRPACCNDIYMAANSREHNYANLLTLGSMVVGSGKAKKIVDVWLSTPWGEERHKRRIDKIMAIEAKYLVRK
ncbi:MAG: ribose 5-phosphate isomerase B [Candidatus Wallbacteria bacterium HGW-Wallbacteria-1]|jgi:ribose 5-phosphate isomerase B|uniref:Ribose 5-phosphate isomerase B n=1 Tax=Candidatus Wallbacteria bacterium HGW-Wallbacteria-1 TaxID=2013854 RepID=A0A2N1PK25_9BACT|nr:MAG: ribose 5-phosphate isomerase B [Candidatus Wallbacteria bacterium HGW-Wallbacteria-1]